ncbi:GNAT family N-acetyltransferase [Parathalassolituus penaei]|uniref:GNAT family N-acetyltransferase n=1 Tax=Parathalassolituus penaei TaxID=2997323 RepID=A0A9X3EFV6_9GAMM|nr:GNAT family N-acetyltransferase [Parathalassolituus penaei]MCY0966792.1 GNAT family N-acetyltransferase [Parathalassolituus penaei]
MPYQIRPLQVSDLSAVMTIQARCYLDIEPERPEVMASKLAIPAHACLACESSQGLAAYLLCHPWVMGDIPALDTISTCPPAGQPCFYLHDLAVDPGARGQKLAQRLVQQALQIARDQGLDHAALVAVQGSLPFWRSLGFTDHTHRLSPELQQRLQKYGDSACYLARSVP